MVAPESRVPVTIITGFLGSGKTTLLNHILTNRQGLRTAVLVNEFGEIGIDHELVVATGETFVELSNGCICCTINSDLVQAVPELLARADSPDCLVVETTGLADPLPVALSFLKTELRSLTQLDSIVTLADAANFSVSLFRSEAAHNQIVYGDVILLNKIDLVAESDLVELEVKIGLIKPGAKVVRTSRALVPLPLILGAGSWKHHDRPDAAILDAADRGRCLLHDSGPNNAGHSLHLENDGFTAVSFESRRPFDVARFRHFLDRQIPAGVFRAKGVLWLQGIDKRNVFHLSGRRVTLDQDEWRGEPANRLVFIGQGLDQSALVSDLNECASVAE
jgi:G3E family GTPase